MRDELLIGIDLGGTEIKAVLTDPAGDILKEKSVLTHDIPGKDNSRQWKTSIKNLIEDLQSSVNQNIKYIGISSPGTVNDQNTGVISNGTKLLGIEGFIWNKFIGREVYVLNDAHAAMMAESRLGVGKGINNLLMITLGTGVGGGIMINGKLVQGQVGRAGHIGHVSVSQDLALSIVNTPGSLENAIGECTVQQRSHGRFSSTKELVEAHLQGDLFATWTWLNSVQALARGIVSFINILSPELIILGGGIAKAGDALVDPLNAFLEIYEWRPKGYETPIRLAKLGNHAGAVGAALFAMEKKNIL